MWTELEQLSTVPVRPFFFFRLFPLKRIVRGVTQDYEMQGITPTEAIYKILN